MSTSLIVDPQQEQQAPDPETANLEPEIPEKYKGKTAAELIEMHRNAESELGRARNEVGTLRRLSDEFLGIRRAELEQKTVNQPKREPITTDRLLEKPEEVLLSTIHSEIEAKNAERDQRTARLEAELAESRFSRQFPNAEKTLTDPAFQDWVRSSPYRQKLALNASQGNFDAAADLFGLYESVKTAAPQEPSNNGTAQARKASLARPGGSTVAGVVPSADGKKIYKREELINMRMYEPEKFYRLSETEDLNTAYREGRVR